LEIFIGLGVFSLRGVKVEEIRIHGRGGQGVVLLGELIALAASYEGKFCRSFPLYGPARRGPPVTSFVQIGREEESTRSMIRRPKYLIILDPNLPSYVDVTYGFLEGGVVVQNTTRGPEEVLKNLEVKASKVCVVDATSIGMKVLGRPIPNTAVLGAFVRATGLVGLESVKKAIMKRFRGEVAERNVRAAELGFENAVVRRVEVCIH